MADHDHIPSPRPEYSQARGIAEAVVSTLAALHPGFAPRALEAVVIQAAWELAAHARHPATFRRMLHRRSHARLLAMSGTLTPINGPRALARD